MTARPSLFPAFIKLAGRPCVVVGAGSVAATKITSLLECGARVTVIAPRATDSIQQLAASRRIHWLPRRFVPNDLARAFLAIAATADASVDRAVFLAAQQRGILSNSVDDPPNCDFYFPAVVRRGPLQIAISTSGESPALAQRLRRELDHALGPQLGQRIERIGEIRREILKTMPATEERKLLLHQLACGIGDMSEVRGVTGTVHFIGAGPGDPELLTLKAHRVLRCADLMLHDDLVSAEIVALGAKNAQVVNVGKRCGRKRITQDEINQRMIGAARQGFDVVRLKSGDPSIFGRLGEEVDALDAAGVPFEIVPGVTAAVAAAASVGAPLTDRRTVSRVLMVSNHHASRAGNTDAKSANDWCDLAREDTTLIVYMPGSDLAGLRDELLTSGLPPDTPAIIVSRASMPDQQNWPCALRELGDAPPMDPPVVLLISRSLAQATASARACLLAETLPTLPGNRSQNR